MKDRTINDLKPGEVAKLCRIRKCMNVAGPEGTCSRHAKGRKRK